MACVTYDSLLDWRTWLFKDLGGVQAFLSQGTAAPKVPRLPSPLQAWLVGQFPQDLGKSRVTTQSTLGIPERG